MSTVGAGGSSDPGGSKPDGAAEGAESDGCHVGRGAGRSGGLAWLIAFALWMRRRIAGAA